jgi:oxygen-independent coproporphyrinogen-3 oxidase
MAAAAQPRAASGHGPEAYLGGAPGFALYVHWPFCRVKCPYCDFNSHVEGMVDQGRWAAALTRELDHFADQIDAAGGGRRRLTSIFFGGGTPSLMAPATCAAVLEAAARRFASAPDLEITLEANPSSAETAQLAGFRAAGVNRLSLGIQALDDGALRQLGRAHDLAETLAALTAAARLFARFSFDLIYARPGQTLAAWQAELARALDLAGDHLSLYQLTIEPGTPFARLEQAGRLVLPDDDAQAAMFEWTAERLAAAGLPAYEVSNHARPGAACRHNLTYWRGGDYVGIGPGAHGRLTLASTRQATETLRMPRAWLAAVERAGHAERPRLAVAPPEHALELLMLGLRLAEGVDLGRLAAAGGRPWRELVDPAELARLQADGFLELAADRLRATAAGRQRLNALLARLLPAG